MGWLFLYDSHMLSQNKLTRKLRGFIPGIALHWNKSKLVSSCLRGGGSTHKSSELNFLH